MFLSQVKILVFLHHLQKEWILFYLKWAWNECLHLKTSEMSIDMGRRIVQCPGSILSREIAIMKKKSPSNSCLETMAIGSAFKTSGSIMPTKRYMLMEREHIPCAGMRWVTVFSRPPLRTSWNNASGSPARSSYPFTDLLSFHCFYAFFVSWCCSCQQLGAWNSTGQIDNVN